MLSSKQLEAFAAVAATGGFSKAAKILAITQSALSQRILNLEEELQTSLFVRQPSGPELTEPGKILLQYCMIQTDIQGEVVSRIKSKRDRPSGWVRIAGFSSIMRSVVIPALVPFFKNYPDVRVHCQTEELDVLGAMLQKNQTDFVLTIRDQDTDGIVSTFLGHEDYVLVESCRGCLPGRSQNYLDHDSNDQTTLNYFGSHLPRPFRRDYFDEIYAIIDAVQKGLGRAVLPKHLTQNIPDIRIINPKRILRYPVYLKVREQAFYSKLHHLVANILITQLSLVFSKAGGNSED